MPRNGVTALVATGLLVVGIVIGAVGIYMTTTYQTKTTTQTETATQTETTTASLTTTATVNAPTVLSYNFQTNDTSGSLFMVFKNYGSLTINILNVYFDQTLVNASSIAFGVQTGRTCGSLMECWMTLYFGHNALPLPSQSDHIVTISTNVGNFQYVVTPGESYSATCTYTESC